MRRWVVRSLVVLAVLHSGAVSGASEPLTVDQRIAAARALESVRWNHRILPEPSDGTKSEADEVLTEEWLRSRVERHLAMSRMLETYWGRPITADQLQSEIERLTRDSRDPGRLREMFAALDDDPHRVAECLARPLLVERTIRGLFAFDSRIHGSLRARLTADLEGAASIEQLATSGGKLSELELSVDLDAVPGLRRASIGADDWDRLSARPVGKLSELIETAEDFSVETVISKSADRLRMVRVRWPKRNFESWWTEVGPTVDALAPVEWSTSAAEELSIPDSAEDTCLDDTWSPTSTGTDVPVGRERHSAVWTGSEMIVFGGRTPAATNTGGRYEPATDSWSPTRITGAPSARFDHSAIWTGSEMIVWGGSGTAYVNTGARYDPTTDSWTAMTTTGAPDARSFHTALLTGGEMIVWGGINLGGVVDTGARYDLTGNSWTALSTVAAPTPRYRHTAVLADDLMIVWGGFDGFEDVNTGGRYDLTMDSWTATSLAPDVPEEREDHTAVWTGTEMIVWGGAGFFVYEDGSRYDPVSDTWTALPDLDTPSNRRWHTAVWSEGEMIVWGGVGGGTSGGRYLPLTDTWSATSEGANVPDGRRYHSAVWIAPANEQMIVWGGVTTTHSNTGGLYCADCPDATWYLDFDLDGFGDPNVSQPSCVEPPGYLLDSSDCDDGAAVVHPGAPQVCDGLNNDCDDPSWPGLAGTNEFDNDGDSFSTCGGDCDDVDPQSWQLPGAARDLILGSDKQTLSWSLPLLPGGSALTYDTIRADSPLGFDAAGTCVTTADPATSSTDSSDPLVDAVFYYLIRAETGCGSGPVGNDSGGTPREATACP